MLSDKEDSKDSVYFTRLKNAPAQFFRSEMNLGGSIRINPTGIAIICGIIILIVYFNSGSSSSGADPRNRSQATVNLAELLSVAIAVAEAGGREVKAVRDQADIGESSKGKTREGANDPKTDGDMRAHVQMFYGLKKRFPNINIISEEHDEKEVDTSKVPMADMNNAEVRQLLGEEDIEVQADDVAVWIDPLDATQEYTEKLLHFVTTMVCVAVRGKPTLGIIHKPFGDDGNTPRTAWGYSASGRDIVSRTVSDDAENNKKDVDMAHARIIVSRSHAGNVKNATSKSFGEGVQVTPAGGAGYKAWEVVKGTQDAYIHTTLIKKWDICAGAAILSALGGKMTSLKGDTIDFGRADQEKNEGGLLATMHQHDEFLEKLKILAR